MTALLVLLALSTLVVALSARQHRSERRRVGLHPFRPAAPFAGTLPADRDTERLVADLRALPGAPAALPLRMR